MPNPRLLAIVTAMLLLGGIQPAGAAYNLRQLQDVEQLILSKDCGALLLYLQGNQEMLEGDDPLAQELRNFAQGVEGGLIQCLSPGARTGAPQSGLSGSY